MKAIHLFLLVTFLAVLSCVSSEVVKPTPIEVSSDFARRTNDFSFSFLKTLHKKEKSEKNFFVSPLGLHMALGMLLNGSANDSEKELLKTLKLEGLSRQEINTTYLKFVEGLPKVDPKVTNTLANSIWQDENFPVEQNFTDLLKEYFKAELYKEDFSKPATVDKINQWASDNTNTKIKKILEEVSPDQVMFLINALYFKGDWSSKFDKKKTYKASFNGLNKASQVDIMSKLDTISYAEMGKFKITELPYGSGQYSMIILLPESESNVNELISSLDTQTWSEALGKLQVRKIEFALPKIKMEYSIKLNEVLEAMGMPILFTSEADLSKISLPAGRLKVGFVKQDSFVEIDEEGTEAAAVTTVGIEVTSLPSYPQFICDKPFLFFIQEKSSNTIQFMGKIVNL